MLAAKSEIDVKGCTVMALLDGGMLRRHKSWLKVGRKHFDFLLSYSKAFLKDCSRFFL